MQSGSRSYARAVAADGLRGPAPRGEIEAVVAMHGHVARIEGERPSIRLFRAGPIPFQDPPHLGEHQVRLGVGGVELQRAQGRAPRALERCARLDQAVVHRADLCAAERGVGAGEPAIERDGLLKEGDRLGEPLVGRLVPVVPALQVGLVRIDVRRASRPSLGRRRQQFDRERMDDFRGDVQLHLEAVGEVPLVGFRPQLRLAAGFDELHRDPRPVALAPHVAFDHEVGTQRLPDVADARRRALDERRRGAGDDAEPARAQPAELRDHFLAQPFGEVFVGRVARQTRERQDGQASLARASVRHMRARGSSDVVASALDRSDEAISAPLQRLDEARTLGVVAERGAQPLDRRVQPVLEIDERPVRPQPVAELVAGEHVRGTLEQHGQNFEWLVLQPDADAVLAQLTRADVELESAEAERASLHMKSGPRTGSSRTGRSVSPIDEWTADYGSPLAPTDSSSSCNQCAVNWIARRLHFTFRHLRVIEAPRPVPHIGRVMHTHLQGLATGSMVVLALIAGSESLAAERLVVRTYNTFGVTAGEMKHARAVAKIILQDAGLEAVWRECLEGCADALGPGEVPCESWRRPRPSSRSRLAPPSSIFSGGPARSRPCTVHRPHQRAGLPYRGPRRHAAWPRHRA